MFSIFSITNKILYGYCENMMNDCQIKKTSKFVNNIILSVLYQRYTSTLIRLRQMDNPSYTERIIMVVGTSAEDYKQIHK